MISVTGGFRNSFKEKILTFCFLNNLNIRSLGNLGDCYQFDISGEISDIDKLENYLQELETERKNKSFWYKLFN
jgi:hypothetical protein